MKPRTRLLIKVGMAVLAAYLVLGLVASFGRHWIHVNLPFDLPGAPQYQSCKNLPDLIPDDAVLGQGACLEVGRLPGGPYFDWYQYLLEPGSPTTYYPADMGVASILFAGGLWLLYSRRRKS